MDLVKGQLSEIARRAASLGRRIRFVPGTSKTVESDLPHDMVSWVLTGTTASRKNRASQLLFDLESLHAELTATSEQFKTAA